MGSHLGFEPREMWSNFDFLKKVFKKKDLFERERKRKSVLEQGEGRGSPTLRSQPEAESDA